MSESLRDKFVQEYAAEQNLDVVRTTVECLYDALDGTNVHCFDEAGADHAGALLSIAKSIEDDGGDVYAGIRGIVYYTTKDVEDTRAGNDLCLSLAVPPGKIAPDVDAEMAEIARTVCERLSKLPFPVEWDGGTGIRLRLHDPSAAQWLKQKRAQMFSAPA